MEVKKKHSLRCYQLFYLKVIEMELQLSLYPQPQPSFHNTTNAKGKELVRLDTAAKSLEDKVLALYSDGKPRNAWEAFRELKIKDRTVIKDSVKRAITNLTSEKFGRKLIKTDIKTKGQYHIPNYQYKLNKI